MAVKRLQNLSSHLTSNMDDSVILPSFDELPSFHNFKGCAWGLWGPDDQLGTVNLLTEKVVAQAASEEIKYVQHQIIGVDLRGPIYDPFPDSAKLFR